MVKDYGNVQKEGFLFEDSQSKVIIEKFSEAGYPEDSFVLNWVIEDKQELDLAILDPKDGKILYIFEFKYWTCTKEEFPRRMRQWIRMAMRKKNLKSELYCVIKLGKSEEIIYTLVNLDDGTYEETELSKIIKPIKAERLLTKNKEIQEKNKEKKESIETLTKLSIGLAIFTGVILVLDICGKIDMTSTRLLLYGAIILLLLLPFANKVKIASIEFEKEKKVEKKE